METSPDRNNGVEIQRERALAYRILRYTPNLVRDEWVNIGVLLIAPDTGERRLRLIEEPAEFSRVRRLHPQADEALLRRLRDDTLSNALQLAQQKGTLAQDLMPSWSGCTTTTWRCNGHRAAWGRRAAARKCVPIASKFSGRLAFGSGSKKEFLFQNSRFPATPCELTTRTGAMACEVSCIPCQSAARPARSKTWPIPQSTSQPRHPGSQSLLRSLMLLYWRRISCTVLCATRCAARASRPCHWITLPCGWRS